MKPLFLFSCFLISSCSSSYYKPIESDNAAHASFSNLSREIPEIAIATGCKQSQVHPRFIQFRKPGDRSRLSLQIPSNQPISFVYDYTWFQGEVIQLVTKGSHPIITIEKRTTKDVKSCREEFTFTPKPNYKYEVYFGKNVNICFIKVSEVFFEPGTNKKHLFQVDQIPKPEC